MRNKNPYDKDWKGFNTHSGSGGYSAFQKAVLSISIIAVFVVAAFSVKMYIHRKRKRSNAVTSSINWQPNYRDRPSEEVNIAPKRGSVHTDVYEQAVQGAGTPSSRRDPMAAHLAAAAAARSEAPESDDELDDAAVSDHEPQVDMGPPLDDDGHELHNVSIV